MSGWVKFHRSYFDHWLFSFKEPDKALAWVYLFGKANHKDGEVLIKGRVKKVKRGQLAESQLTLQKRFGWSQNKLKRFLQLLEKSEMIEYETDDLTTLITICNYDSFQGSEEEGERSNGRPVERPVERTTDDQSNDKQECNNGKNENNGIIKPIVPKFSPSHMEFAKGMFLLIKQVAEKTKEPNFEKWADELRLMNEVDGHELEEMSKVFKWANKDSFWRTNILSPSKFRKQYSVLHSKMKANSFGKESKVLDRNMELASRFVNS